MTGRLTASTGFVVLLGDPVGHSLSPVIHNAAFEAQGIDLAYLACPVESHHLGAAMEGLHVLGAVGANVTLPHKTDALRLAETASPAARALGAANTLVREPNGWQAENTDVAGFLAPLRAHAVAVAGSTVVVLGAGGAARAVAYGCLTGLRPARLTVVARRPEQAARLLQDLDSWSGETETTALSPTEGGAAVRAASLVVNATPLGMGDGRTPWADAEDFRPGQIVYDLVYRPTQTPLLAAARQRGATTIGGLPMLLAQAAASYRFWTGQDMPHDVVKRAVEAAL